MLTVGDTRGCDAPRRGRYGENAGADLAPEKEVFIERKVRRREGAGMRRRCASGVGCSGALWNVFRALQVVFRGWRHTSW